MRHQKRTAKLGHGGSPGIAERLQSLVDQPHPFAGVQNDEDGAEKHGGEQPANHASAPIIRTMQTKTASPI